MMLDGRVAIITGAGSGIGRAIAKEAALEGARVVLVGRTQASLVETSEMIAQEGGESLPVTTDVTDKGRVTEMVAACARQFGPPDILVNNAGTDIKGRIQDLPEETWDHLMALNLKGTFLCTQAVMKSMIARRYGRIVNISSMAGRTGEPFTSAYCTTKFGLIGFTQAVAQEVGQYGITINAVCPGPVDTELIVKSISQSAEIAGVTFEEFKQRFFIGPTPLGRMATPLDVARAVIFFASEDAEFITGTALNVSGGREMH